MSNVVNMKSLQVKKSIGIEIKDFVCDECSYASSEIYLLNRHTNHVHKRIKDFVCD